MKIELPEKVKFIIQTLQQNGFEAYAVGGCVRDSILGRVPEDWDITSSASPYETRELFDRSFDTGIEHGTITVMIGDEGFEVTTYRIDGKYEDSRHPKEVTFTRCLTEDLKRRDFTINAMAYNDESGLVDIFGGIQDLKDQVIRCVGNPLERFSEDALRIMRAIRFSAQLGFQIEEETKRAISVLAPNLKNISAERIQTELVKLLVSPHPELIREAYKMGITSVILPEFDLMMKTEQETPHHDKNVGDHTIAAMCLVDPDKVLRLTMLFHDSGKPAKKTMDEKNVAHFKGHAKVSTVIAKDIMRRLKFDNDTIRKVTKLVEYHDYRMSAEPKNVRRAMNKISEELFPYYTQVRRADVLAQSMYHRKEKIQNLDEVEAIYHKIVEQDQCVSLRNLAINGKDLIKAGIRPGPVIGVVLDQLLNLVIEDPSKNTKEILLQEAENVIYEKK